MFNQMGDLLHQQGKQYSVRYDPRSGAWHILNLWHDSLASLSPSDEVPIDSPALKILPADAFNALIEEANRLGVLARFVGPTIVKPKSGEEASVKGSDKEFYRFKTTEHALDVIRQVVVSSNLQGLVE